MCNVFVAPYKDIILYAGIEYIDIIHIEMRGGSRVKNLVQITIRAFKIENLIGIQKLLCN